jgi:hypothetical protein
MTARLRQNSDEGPLFLCAVAWNHQNKVPDQNTHAEFWRCFLRRIKGNPVIGSLPIERRMIRKTRADLQGLKDGADHTIAQIALGHSSGGTTMQSYFTTPWFRRELQNHIRRFQKLFEAALSTDIPDVARHLGISEEELANRRELANETGLGFLCLRPHDGIQPGTTKGQRCDKLDRCHLGCEVRRFVPTDRAMMALHLTNKSLHQASAEWIVKNQDRWKQVWMPLLAETEAFIERLRESAFRTRMKAAAAEEVERLLSTGDLALIKPW